MFPRTHISSHILTDSAFIIIVWLVFPINAERFCNKSSFAKEIHKTSKSDSHALCYRRVKPSGTWDIPAMRWIPRTCWCTAVTGRYSSAGERGMVVGRCRWSLVAAVWRPLSFIPPSGVATACQTRTELVGERGPTEEQLPCCRVRGRPPHPARTC